ncbi:Protein TusC [Pseudoalteromonas holothuriae]|uniref:Protein TusC n=1 Tax=Pseudoalteromonas holothuriae TaxID=2963714 RepID=A0A9W4QZX5_9GAMM|nr:MULTISPECIES: sulfurtransferase complex subunit TusC [unclassified Pseudoalteromonas]CAH9060340.1 Protein TusC [Pseudoalteromonas sp. CIP111951]CAH9060514.1 Protein TusC [Pseudoalteromonas sp. CIP111854]
MKNVLVISTTSPFDRQKIRDALDTALIYAAIDQNISWLLLDSAVLALKKPQSASHIGLKDYFKAIKTLEIYDIEQVYVCADAMEKYQLDEQQLNIAVIALNKQQQQQLLQQQNFVVNL